MSSKQQSWNSFSRTSSPAAKATLAVVIVLALTVVSATSAQAQTEPYEAIHRFTHGQHGSTPFAGWVMDKAGNLHGPAVVNGNGGLNPKGSNVAGLRNLATDTGSAISITTLSRTNGSGPVTYGQEVDILATVTGDGSSGTPTGTVAFTVNGNSFDTNCDSVLLTRLRDNVANAPCNTTLLPAGNPTTITGRYNGDGTYSGSQGTLDQVVNRASTTTTVTSSQNPSTYLQPVTFTATVVGQFGGPATGPVAFTDNGITIPNCGAVPLNGGMALCTTSALTAGSHLILGTYWGDENFTGSTGTLSPNQVVNKADTLTTVTSSLNPSTYLELVTFTATVTGDFGGTPTGTVNFTDNGTRIANCAAVPLNNGQAQCATSTLAMGTHTIAATYSGDSNYHGSTGSLLQVVEKPNTTTTVTSSLNPSTYGQPVTFTATVTGSFGTPTGTVTFTWDGNPIPECPSPIVLLNGVATCATSSLAVGQHAIKASYSGDFNYAPSSGTLTQVVNEASTTTTVTSSANPSVVNQPVIFTATVTAIGGGTPFGTVAFTDNGVGIPNCSAVNLGGNGQAQCTTAILTLGSHTILANYSGDSHFTPSTGTLSPNQVVNKADTTVVVASSVNPSQTNQPVTFTATVTPQFPGSTLPTGTVAFTDNGVTIPNCGAVSLGSDGQAQCTTATLTVGSHTIAATYSGDSNYHGSTGSLLQVVEKPNTTTTVTSSLNPSTYGQPITFTATVTGSFGTPTGTVTFTWDGNPIPECPSPIVLLNGVATCATSSLPAGEHTIEARYFGDSNYNASSGTLSQIVNPGPPPVQFVAVTPCRLVDTRPQYGGNGPIQGGTFQSFPIPQVGGCNIPTTAVAYSLNVSVVPSGPLGYLTIWPTGGDRPLVATLNSLDGRIKADAAIVPAGADGAVSIYVTNTTNVVLDINGYFAPVSSSTLAFYPLPPCRVADTRYSTYPQGLGPPYLTGGVERAFPILNATTCNIPSSAAAYSLNFSVVPHSALYYMTVWPTGESRPVVSTLNDIPGQIIANAAIVVAGTGGEVSIYPTNDTDLVIDINGYFAPAGAGGLSLYTAAPCRVIDTRHVGSGQPFSGKLTPPVDVVDSRCGLPAAAQAYVFNATVVPTGALGYLTLWPDGANQPLVSTLNALDGSISSNMAIVPNINGKTDAFASGTTQLILDISSYFAP